MTRAVATGVFLALLSAGAAADNDVAPAGAATTTPEATLFIPVAPTRVLVARQISAGQSVEVDVRNGLGRDLPAGTQAVAVNVTVAGISQDTFVSVCPAGLPKAQCSDTSTINPYAGRDVANFAISALGPSARGRLESLQIFNDRGSVLVYIDLLGFYVGDDDGATGGTDTLPGIPRRDNDVLRLGPGDMQSVTLDNTDPEASAVLVRATAAGVTRGTFISVCPSSATKEQCSGTSTLNPAGGRDTSNLAIVPFVGNDRTIKVYNNLGSAIVYLDVVGFQVPVGRGYRYVPLPPERYLAKEPLGEQELVQFVDDDVSARIMGLAANVTTSGNTATTYLSTCLGQMNLPQCQAISTVNSYPGQDTAAGTLITTSPLGNINFKLYNNMGDTLVDLDVVGFYVDTRVVIDAVVPTERLSTYSKRPSVSSDGGRVAFESTGDDLAPGDSGGTPDVLVYDESTGDIVRASQTAAGVRVPGGPTDLKMAGNGRYVVFSNEAATRGAGTGDVYRKDLTTGQLVQVSTTTAGAQLPGWSDQAVVSDNGRFVAFRNNTPDATGGIRELYLKDMTTGTLTAVTPPPVRPVAVGSPDEATPGGISADGRLLVYETAKNLFTSDINNYPDVFVYDRIARTTRQLSTKSDGSASLGASIAPSMDESGTTVVFSSNEQLDPADDDGQWDVYSTNVTTGRSTLVSVGRTRDATITQAEYGLISGDGRFVALQVGYNVYIKNPDGQIRLASKRGVIPGGGESLLSDIDRTGEHVAFAGTAGPDKSAGTTDYVVAYVATIDWPAPN